MKILSACSWRYALYLVFGGLMSFNTTLYSQHSLVLDSLLTALEASKDDSSKIELYFELAQYHDYQNPRKANIYGHKIIQLASKNNYYKALINAYSALSGNYIRLANTDSAFIYSKQALLLADQQHFKKIKPSLLNNLGLAHSIKGDWHKAIKYYNEGLDLIEEMDETFEVSVNICNNLGVIFMDQKEYDKALKYFTISYDVSTDLNDTLGMSIALTNIGEAYYHKKALDIALVKYKEALVLSESINDEYGIGYLLNNMATVHFENGALEEATAQLNQSIKIAQRLNDKEGMMRIFFTLSGVAQKKKQYLQSVQYAKSGLKLAQEIRSRKYCSNYYELIAKGYELSGQPAEALTWFQQFKALNDTLFNEQKNKQLAELSIQYDTKKKENENLLLKEEQAKNEALIQRKTTLSVAAILGFVLVSLIAAFLYWKNQLKQQYNQRLQDLVEEKTKDLKASNQYLERSNKELEQFAYICSHDLKEPLRNIHGFTGLLNRSLGVNQSESTQEYIGLVQSNIKQMNGLIEGILEYSKVGHDKEKIEKTDLNLIANNLKPLLFSSLKEKNVDLKINELPTLHSNGSLVFIVLKNLVENAIKYNESEKPTIEISSTKVDAFYHIEVKDNGIGIEAPFFEQIFTIFKRLHSRQHYKGAGIGLSICEKIIKQLGGTIWVESDYGVGSRFIFSLPSVDVLLATKKQDISISKETKKPQTAPILSN